MLTANEAKKLQIKALRDKTDIISVETQRNIEKVLKLIKDEASKGRNKATSRHDWIYYGNISKEEFNNIIILSINKLTDLGYKCSSEEIDIGLLTDSIYIKVEW